MSTLFTTTGAKATPTDSRNNSVVSNISFTGVVSGNVTINTRHLSGSVNICCTSMACERNGPPRMVVAIALGDCRKLRACPAAGASTTMRSWSPSGPVRPTRCLILPNTNRSSMPGAALETTPTTPVATKRLARRASPWVAR